MKNKNSWLVIFSVGGILYGLLEILWRGYTHWSMVMAGGLCFSFFSIIGEKMKKTGLLIKGLTGGAFITAIEFLFGLIFNIILKKKVWDYSKMPYSFFWVIISTACIPFACFLKRKITK